MGYEAIKIARYNDEGILIDKFESITKASKEIDTQPSNIIKSYTHNIKCKGFYFKPILKNKVQEVVKVSKYRKGGKAVKIFVRPRKLVYTTTTITEASDYTSLGTSTVKIKARNEEWATSGDIDYFFKFVKPEDAHNRKSSYKPADRIAIRKNNTVIPIKLTSQNGTTYKYKSITDAANSLNVQRTSIVNVLAGRWNTVEGYSVERI